MVRRAAIAAAPSPFSSVVSDCSARPRWPGTTTSTVPPRVDAQPGWPTSYAHRESRVSMPQESITESTPRTVSSLSTRSPVTGWTPPCARVPASRARSSTVTAAARTVAMSSSSVSGSASSVSRDFISHAADRVWCWARFSARAADSVTVTSRSNRAESSCIMRAVRSRPPRPFTREAVATAPAFCSGLCGRPVTASTSTRWSRSRTGAAPTRSPTRTAPRSSRACAWNRGEASVASGTGVMDPET